MSDDVEAGPIRVERIEDGALWSVRLGGSRGNVLDGTAIAALTGVFRDASRDRHVKAIVLYGDARMRTEDRDRAEVRPHARSLMTI